MSVHAFVTRARNELRLNDLANRAGWKVRNESKDMYAVRRKKINEHSPTRTLRVNLLKRTVKDQQTGVTHDFTRMSDIEEIINNGWDTWQLQKELKESED